MLNKNEIKKYLKNDLDVICFDTIDSTNTYAKQLFKSGKGEDFVVVSSEQTNGRGRQGKSFYSPKNTGIYMSVAVHSNLKLESIVTTTTASSVAVCKAIEEVTDINPKIKWVNDIYVNDCKICGILTESVTGIDFSNVYGVIIGIGININTKDFPSDILNAGSLNKDVNKEKLIAIISDNIVNIVGKNYSDFLDYYVSHSMLIGKDINYFENNVKKSGKVIGIDEKGGLMLESNGEKITLTSGEITVRQK